MKNNKKSGNYTKISKGIQRIPSGNYRVRRCINGNYYDTTVTSIKAAKEYYNNPY